LLGGLEQAAVFDHEMLVEVPQCGEIGFGAAK
jgi:hypothetical protein